MFRPDRFSFFCVARQPITRHLCLLSNGWRSTISAPSNLRYPYVQEWSRCASRSSKPIRSNKAPRKVTGRRQIGRELRMSQGKASPKSSPLGDLNEQSSLKLEISSITRPKGQIKQRPSSPRKYSKEDDDSETIVMEGEELAIQREIIKNRRKILGPTIWTIVAVGGTVGLLAYLDARYPIREPMPERTQLPQNWYLTPTIVKEGIKAGWNELDKLTIGIVVASIGVHFLKRSPLPIWENLIHITGERKITAFTYPFVHSNWTHLGFNAIALCWFFPGVIRYLDGDLFHAAALFTTVPLLISYLDHFAFRWGLASASSIPMNMGSSGAMAAMFGAYCLLYPDEKVWNPQFLALRLDAKYFGLLFFILQITALANAPKGGNRPALMAHIVSMGLGAAYIQFNGKELLWKPLVARFAKTDDDPPSP